MTDKEFCVHILAQALVKAGAQIYVQGASSADMIKEMLAMECCKALRDIREILDDDTLEDRECFQRIERIVSLYEELGPGAGSRHDFG